MMRERSRQAAEAGKRYAKVLGYSWPLLQQAAPRESRFLLGSLILQGIFPAIIVLLTTRIINTVSVAITQRQSLGKQFGGTELSGGEWQKLALARALLRPAAQLLILDEPTAALDPKSEFELYQQFTELSRGITTLLITHRLGSVRLADRIYVLESGQVIEEGSHESLLQAEGRYAALWKMQAGAYTAF